MGIVFQDFRLIDKMNVFDNVAFAMRAVGKPSAVIKKRVPYVLELGNNREELYCVLILLLGILVIFRK